MEKKSDSANPFTNYQKFLIAVLALLQFTVVLDFMVLSPLGDALIKSLAIDPARFSLVVSAYAFSAGASGLLSAGFADRYDRKKLLLFFYAGFIVGTLGCALAQSYPLLLAARIVTGLFGGVIGSVSLAIVADEFVVEQRGRVMGVVQMAFAASQVLGIPAALELATRWDWHVPFLLIVALGVLIGGAIWWRMQPVTRHLALQNERSAFGHLWHTVSNPEYQTGFLAIAFLAVGGFMLMPFGSAFLVNNVKIGAGQLSLVYLFTGIASLAIMPLVGRLSDRVNKFGLFAAGSVLALVMVLIYTHLGPAPLWEVVVINVVMMMGIMSRIVPANTLNTSVPDLKDRGAYMSITSSLQQIAGGVAAIGAGLIVKQATEHSPLENYNVLGYVVAVVLLVCIYLMYRVSVVVKRKRDGAGVVGVSSAVAAPVGAE